MSPLLLIFHQSGGFESRPFVRGLKGRSVSMRSPSKARDTLNKVLPLRWSFGSKDRRKLQGSTAPPEPPPGPAELVEYLESGRRPRCTKEPIVSLMAGQPAVKDKARHGHPGVGGLNCLGRPEEDGLPESPGSQVAEGQRRTSSAKTSSLRRSGKSSVAKEESPATSTHASTGTLGRSTLTHRKDGGRQGSSNGPREDVETGRGSSSGVQHSVSTPSLRQGSLSRTKEQAGRAERPMPQRAEQGSRGGEEAKGHDGMFSFLKGNFLKKDKDTRRTRQVGGDGDADPRKSSSSASPAPLSLSNGEAGGTSILSA